MQEELKIISGLINTHALSSKKLEQIEEVLVQYSAVPKVTIQFLQQVYDQLVAIPNDKNHEACQEKKLLQHKLDTLKAKITNQILDIKNNL